MFPRGLTDLVIQGKIVFNGVSLFKRGYEKSIIMSLMIYVKNR